MGCVESTSAQRKKKLGIIQAEPGRHRTQEGRRWEEGQVPEEGQGCRQEAQDPEEDRKGRGREEGCRQARRQEAQVSQEGEEAEGRRQAHDPQGQEASSQEARS